MIRDTRSSWVGFAGFGLVATVVGSAFLLRGPLETRRPEQQAATAEALAAKEVVRARLWQDPLHAIETHWNGIESDEPGGAAVSLRRDSLTTIKDMSKTLNSEEELNPEEQLESGEELESKQLRNSPARLLLLVPMSSEPYAEDSENRRRQRHAVVSALTENDYVPRYAKRLGYFTAPCFDCDSSLGNGPQAANGTARKMRIGFESYEAALEAHGEGPQNSHWQSIHVLWLNAQDFQTCLLYRVSALAAYLDGPGPKPDRARTVLVGPTTSGALGRLRPAESEKKCVESVSKWWRAAERSTSATKQDEQGEQDEKTLASIEKRRERLMILSPSATVPLELLFPELDDEKRGCLRARTVADAWRADICFGEYLGVASFDSVVARDDVVLSALLDEFRDRGATRPLIAIVSEQDSAYGRLLDDVVEELVNGNKEQGGDGPMDGFEVAEYGYLAGVDGEMPPLMAEQKGREASEGTASTGPGSPSRSSIIRRHHEEAASGAQQLDYVRRLADRIAYDLASPGRHTGDGAPQRGPGGGGGLDGLGRIVVVGVLGSDVYDKLLIIQALRDRLPAATFFTTDLDARLTHPDVFRWTRNLIVGSPYGLTVKDLKGAPFRDSYQTATFRAVTLALQEEVPAGGAAPPPRLFEIGRTGAVPITRRAARTDEAGPAELTYVQVHGDEPSRRSVFRRVGEWLLVLAPLLVLVVFAVASKRALPEKAADLRRKARGQVALAGVSMIVLAVLAGLVLEGHEPRPLLEGVNSLPTLVLYLTTLVYAYAAVAIGAARIEQAKRAFQEEWDLPSRPLPSSREIRGLMGRRGPLWLSNWKQDVPRTRTEMPKKKAEECWSVYLKYGARNACIARVAIPIFSSLIVVLAVVFLVSPQAPLLTRSYHDLVKWVGVFTTVGVVGAVCFCDDVLRLGRALVREIGRHEVVGWPKVEPTDHVGQHWRTMRFLELYTDSVVSVAALPLVLLALLIFARSTLFEGWVWTGQILGLFAGLVVYVAVRALSFQMEAVRAKNAILWCLDSLRLGRIGEGDEREVTLQVEIVKERIEGIRRGAFGPWIRHPIVQSLLLPSLAYGLVVLLESSL